tara:strand:+ start:1074 stop:2180 length:1107 start_codon:yes stop_codon:yes gene_type:complete
MKFLFFLVHPAKFHFHKNQINTLKKKGHLVDIIIIKKDMLEDLVIEEGWNYKNIFPEGRKINGLHTLISALISMVRTIYRLWAFTSKKDYDIYVGDLLTVIGRVRGIPSFYPTDDVFADIYLTDQIFYIPTDFIFAPKITDMGPYDYKTIRYDGYKALAHLHPNCFSPDSSKLPSNLKGNSKYFIIRCTGFEATHDLNKHGITDKMLKEIVNILSTKGDVFISTERKLPESLKKYQLQIPKRDISHYMFFADLFISDSTTMTTEAAVLGTPSIEYDDYFEGIEQMLEIANKYNLTEGFAPGCKLEEFYSRIDTLSSMSRNKIEEFRERRTKLLDEKIDVSAFFTWLIENYPESVSRVKKDSEFQYSFK